MNICVGGELDGQVIEHEGRFLKASAINPELTSEYQKQLFIQGDDKYHCWLDTSMPFSEACDQAIFRFRKHKGYIS